MNRTSILVAAALWASPALAADIPATLVLEVGDLIASSGLPVTTVERPEVNADGTVCAAGSQSDGAMVVLADGTLIFDGTGSTAVTDIEFEGPSCNATGSYLFEGEDPAASTITRLFANGSVFLTEGDPAPGFPSPATVTFFNATHTHSSGAFSWVGSTSTTGTTTSSARALYYTPTGLLADAIILLQSGDVVSGQTLTTTTTGVDTDGHVSDDGSHYIAVGDLDGAATGVDGVVVVDDAIVLTEGDPQDPTFGNWDNFDVVEINNAGDYLITGDVDGDFTTDEFVSVNGVPIVREGDTIAGVTLTSSASVQEASINNLGQVAHQWSFLGSEALFVTCDPTDPVGSTRLVAQEGDGLDFDGDGVADAILEDFNNTNTNRRHILGDDGTMALEVDLDRSGTTSEAVVAFANACCPDGDGDGVCDADDLCPLDNPDDSDGDGICDSDDLCTGTDSSGDTDLDGVCDDEDICPLDNPDDIDGDGICESADLCTGADWTGDADGDGVCNDTDFGLLVTRVSPGQPMSFLAVNAPANETIAIAATIQGTGGNTPCEGFTCGDLRAAVVLGRVVADTNGFARLDLTVPSSISPGAYLTFQAVYAGDVTEIVTRRVRP